MTNIQFQSGAIDATGAISNAWELIKQNYGMYLGIAVVAIVLTGCIPCLNLFIIGPVMGGVFFVVLRAMRQEPVEFGMMFKGFEKFVPLMVIGLIQAIPGVIAQVLRLTINLGQLGLSGGRNGDFQFFQSSDRDVALAGGLAIFAIVIGIAFAIFALVWWAVMFFAIPLAMEYDLGPVDAIKLSAQAAMGNIGGLILLLIFQVLIVLLGTVMLCIGIFLISIPVIYVTNAFVFRQVFPRIDQNFNMAPPPPTAYGDFGAGMPAS
ncbi:MAG: hypothetical protein ACKVQJ_08100 [Pyrinomonadaceae bacterium]